jgi:transcriptional regulator with XRE-family HTH domain
MRLLDAAVIRHRRAELGISSRVLAAQCGVTPPSIAALEAGTNHNDLSVAMLVKLAKALALDPSDIILSSGVVEAIEKADSAPHVEEPSSVDVGTDRATVGAILFTTGVLTPLATLCEVLGWSPPRLETAVDALDVHLRGAGLRVHRLALQVGVRRAVDAVDKETLAASLRRHMARDGLSLSEARILERVARRDLPHEPTKSESIAIGILLNASALVHGEPAVGRFPPLELTDDVRFSLLLDDVPIGQRTGGTNTRKVKKGSEKQRLS